MSVQTIFAILWGWTLVAIIGGLLFARTIPSSRAPQRQEPADVQSEVDDRVAAQVRAVEFHNGSNLTQERSNHG